MKNRNEILEGIVKKSGKTQEDFANSLGLKKAAFNNYIKGRRDIPNSLMESLLKIYNINPAVFFEENVPLYLNNSQTETNILSIYEKLEPQRQQIVYDTAKQQLHEQEATIEESKICYLPTIENSPAAANPTELIYGDVSIEDQAFIDVPTGADFAVLIHGNSMEPLIEDGSHIFVKKQTHIENGEIALVEIDGDGVTCKKIFFNPEDGSIILHSLNPEYDDRELAPERVRIVGKVLV